MDVLIFETIENDCELYFQQIWMKTLIRAIKFLSYQTTTLEILLPKIWSLKISFERVLRKMTEFLNIFYSQNLSSRF